MLRVADISSCKVTPGITALEYASRRTKLAAKLPPGAVAVIAAADVKFRSGAVFYEFHQDSDFFYLTGWLVYSGMSGLLTGSRLQ